MPGIQGGPLMHVIAAKAVALGECLEPGFAEYIRRVKSNARLLGECLVERGYKLVSGGTDNHLLLLDLGSDGLSGKAAEQALEAAGITVNKNMVPFDSRSPLITSGIRIGTAALSTRGMGDEAMRTIAGLIDRALRGAKDPAVLQAVLAEVRELAAAYPLYR